MALGPQPIDGVVDHSAGSLTAEGSVALVDRVYRRVMGDPLQPAPLQHALDDVLFDVLAAVLEPFVSEGTPEMERWRQAVLDRSGLVDAAEDRIRQELAAGIAALLTGAPTPIQRRARRIERDPPRPTPGMLRRASVTHRPRLHALRPRSQP